jgi:hypothetical protein
MARVKSAVAGEGIPTEEEAASTPSVAAAKTIVQNVVRVINMDGERDLSTPRGQQLAHMYPFRGGCMLCYLREESRGVAAESIKFRDSKGIKGMKRMSRRLLTPFEYFSNLAFSARRGAISGDGGLETPNKPETMASKAGFEPRMP